jgi:trans-aconitate 2-methyltransferase
MSRCTMKWDPNQYLKFSDERLRPGLDLMAQLPPISAGRAVDLGCGTGALTVELARRMPGVAWSGIDLSAEMLAQARAQANSVGVAWYQGDIGTWQPEAAYELIYSNATLHWLPDHQALFGRLMDALVPGGVLAVQMPRNFAAPSHALLRDVLEQGPWHGSVEVRADPVATPAQYFDWLKPRARHIDVWETEYLHQLTGSDPVLNWVRGTALRPVLAALSARDAAAFETDYAARLRQAYPTRGDGVTLFPFRRLFLVAHKA